MMKKSPPPAILVVLGLTAAICACVGEIGETAGIPAGSAGSAGSDGEKVQGATPPITCDGPDLGATPRRIWRLSETQYLNTVAAAFLGRDAIGKPGTTRIAGLESPFDSIVEQDRFSTYADSYSMTDLEFQRAMGAAHDIAGALVARLRKDPTSCLGGAAASTPFATCLKNIVAQRGELLLRRPLTTDEANTYNGIASKHLATFGEDETAILTFQTILLSPHFLFRVELGSSSSKLDAYELAAALAYGLTDWPADASLWSAAAKGELATTEQIRAQVMRLIGDGSQTASPTRRFLGEFFRYPDTVKVAKDLSFHDPDGLIRDTDRLIVDLLKANGRQGLLKALLTTPSGYASPKTMPSYGMKATAKGTDPQKVMFPAAERAGILTQPSFLTAFSDTDHNLPVQRGKFISETLLCRPIPPLPIGLVPKLPDLGPDATMRAKLAVHSKDACWACHQMMDPVGLGLEGFDHAGRFRTMEGTRPADASGELIGAGPVDGKFTGAVDLAGRLAASPVVEQCFVTHSFRFWLGRPEGVQDRCALADAVAAHARTGGDYLDLVATLFTSKSFLYRK